MAKWRIQDATLHTSVYFRVPHEATKNCNTTKMINNSRHDQQCDKLVKLKLKMSGFPLNILHKM